MKLTKKQKKNLKTGIIAVILIVVILYFGFRPLTVVTIRTFEDVTILPLQTGEFNFAGYSGTYETPYLGSVSCLGSPGSYYCYVGTQVLDRPSTRFSNSLQSGQTLVLSSSANGEDSYENYIKTKIILPKGTLQVYYNYNIFSHQPCTNNQIIFKVDNEVRGFKVACISGKDHSKSDSGSFEVILEEVKEIEISVLSNVNSPYQTGSGTINLDFEKFVEPLYIDIYRLQENKCNQMRILSSERTEFDFDTLEQCANRIINNIEVYRFQDNQCSLIVIVEDKRTELDFDSLEECEQNIPPKIPILPILGVILLVGILIFAYFKTKSGR